MVEYDGDRQRRPKGFWTARSLKTIFLIVTGVISAIGLVTAYLVSRGSIRHPRTCSDAGTQLYKLSGSKQVPIDEWQLIQMLKDAAPMQLMTVIMRADAATSRCFPGKNVSATLHLRGKSSDGVIMVQHMCHCLSSFNATLDVSNGPKKLALPRSDDINTIVDLGANVGMSAMSFAIMNPEAKIIAIEAGVHNYVGLRANVASNRNIRTELAAIWDSDGFTRLNGSIVSQQTQVFSDMASTVAGAGDFEEMQGMGMMDLVTALSMPTLMSQFSLRSIDLLKVDVEGAEVVLFTDRAASWLKHVWCILVEVHTDVDGRSSQPVPQKWLQRVLKPLMSRSGFKHEKKWAEYDIFCQPRSSVVEAM